MSTSLFAPEEILPVVVGVSSEQRLLSSYTTLLLNEPPVKSLRPEECPDETERRRRARVIAAKDVPRLVRSTQLSALEIQDAGRVAAMKATLADWLRDFTEGQMNGGNPTETDIEELAERTRQLLGGVRS